MNKDRWMDIGGVGCQGPSSASGNEEATLEPRMGRERQRK